MARQSETKMTVSLVFGERLEKPAGPSHPIEWHFDNIDPAPAAGRQRSRGVNGKRNGIVIGMAALVAVGQDVSGAARCKFPDL